MNERCTDLAATSGAFCRIMWVQISCRLTFRQSCDRSNTFSEFLIKHSKKKKKLTAQLWWGMDLFNLMQPALILLMSGQVQSRDRKGPSHIQQTLHPLWYCLQLLKKLVNGLTQCLHCSFTLIHKWWWIPFLQFKNSNKCITVFIIYLFTCILWGKKNHV